MREEDRPTGTEAGWAISASCHEAGTWGEGREQRFPRQPLNPKPAPGSENRWKDRVLTLIGDPW